MDVPMSRKAMDGRGDELILSLSFVLTRSAPLQEL